MLATLVIEATHLPAPKMVDHPSYYLGRITDPVKQYSHFQSIARLEDITFRLLCEVHGANFGDIDPNYDVEDGNELRIPTEPLEERIRTNPLVRMWYPDVYTAAELKEASRDLYHSLNIQVMADIYGQDLYALRRHGERTPICVMANGKYVGHIYRQVIAPRDKEMNLIGIRESLTNTYYKSCGDDRACYGIAAYLLTAAIEHARSHPHGFEAVQLSSPIGGMRERAAKLGWWEGEYYKL